MMSFLPPFPKVFVCFTIFLTGALVTSCERPEPDARRQKNAFNDSVMVQIYDAADRRATKELLPYARSETADYRMTFARVMGSVQDTTALSELENLLADPIPSVRLYAAFSVGQMGRTSSVPALETAMNKESVPAIKAEILEAIGKCADEHVLEYLISYDPTTAEEETGKLYGIYRALARVSLKEGHLPVCVAHLSSAENETRLIAAHILARRNSFPLDEYKAAILAVLDKEEDPEIRTALLRAMSHCTNVNDVYLRFLSQDPDARVRAVATEQCDPIRYPESRKYIIDALKDGSPWVAMAAAQKYTSMNPSAEGEYLRGLALTTRIPEVRAAIVAKTIGKEPEEGWALYAEIMSRFKNHIERGVVFSALSSEREAIDTLLNHILTDGPMGTAALQAVITGGQKFPEWRRKLYGRTDEIFSHYLPAQTAIMAAALRDEPFAGEAGVPDSILKKSLLQYSSPGEIETSDEIRRTLAFRGGEEFIPEPPEYNHPIDRNLLASLDPQTKAVVYTEAGKLYLQLLPEDAPGTVSNFVRLAKDRFYDGTAFHRVVPAFVSQGGGPRGDGFGSTDYTIRSEYSPLRYGTGVVGMASAGKDTESCQFFFTHGPTPHLEGRYSIFGAITSGLEVLNQLTTGTRIDSIRISH